MKLQAVFLTALFSLGLANFRPDRTTEERIQIGTCIVINCYKIFGESCNSCVDTCSNKSMTNGALIRQCFAACMQKGDCSHTEEEVQLFRDCVNECKRI